MNGADVLEDRLREAFARRAAATNVGEPRTATAVELEPLVLTATPRRHGPRGRWVAAGAGLATAAAALGWLVVVDDGAADHGDRTDAGPGTTAVTTATGEPGPLVEYAATTLPTGYAPADRNDIGGDVDDEVMPARFGTNCLDWHAGTGGPVCERVAAVRNRHYGRPGTSIGVTVSTFVNAPFPVVPETGTRPATVQGTPAHLEPATAASGPRLFWEPEAGIVVLLNGLDPAVTEDDLRTMAEALRAEEVPLPDDLAYAVARLDLPAGLDASTGATTAYLWDRPLPDRCFGGLLDNVLFACAPLGADEVLSSLGNAQSAVLGGSVSPAVDRVAIETVGGGTLEPELIAPGAPFTDRVFLTPVGADRPTAVVALAADGTELARHTL